jgi:hypothetical protein
MRNIPIDDLYINLMVASPGSRIENYERKKPGKNDKSNDWKSMESFIVELGTVQRMI